MQKTTKPTKVYQVKMPYYDDDHDHGYYASPLFATKKDAENFLNALKALPDSDGRKWHTHLGMEVFGPEHAYIDEMEVVKWDGTIKGREEYLVITYT